MQSEKSRSPQSTATTTNTTTGSTVLVRSPTPPLDSSIEDIDDLCIDHDLDGLEDDIPCAPRKHFLDYDSIPPPGFEDGDECSSTIAIPGGISGAETTTTLVHTDQYQPYYQHHNSNNTNPHGVLYPNESRKVDKKYERDGEISDFELAGTNSMKAHRNQKQSNNANTITSATVAACNFSGPTTNHHQPLFVKNTGTRRKKHFLDENPIPPDYEIDPADREREHRSLDRNFERTTVAKDYDVQYERKHSLDRERPKKIKEPSFAMARFLEHEQQIPLPPIYRGTWPADRPNDTQYTTSTGNLCSMPPGEFKNLGPIGPKVECVYSLLSMLGCNNQSEMASKFLELSKTPETCAALRHSRCIPLIVQMIHSDADEQTRKSASLALHNVVNCHPDDKAGRREAKVLRHIEQIMDYCESLKSILSQGEAVADDIDRHPSQPILSLMKTSFDEEHRHAMCQLGALQAIASMVYYDHAVHGSNSLDERCISLRRYAGMALTNLTFGDGNNKALLCTNKDFMKALVAQLESKADDLLQVTASVLRNLSWRADNTMKDVLNQIGTVTALTHAVMRNQNENTIKSLLSALWNLSAHCSTNKAEFCAVEGALAFLVDMLVYEGPSKTLTIIENAGGILRNVSSHIAVKESYRAILRKRNCLGILLQQLSSESLTIVSNACGTLWNLSARCPEDQKFLLDNKAEPMLSLLIHSKHKMISNGSSAALKNLLNFRPRGQHNSMDAVAKSMKLKELPSLNVRKQRALEKDLDQNLSETCENIEITTPPKEHKSIDDYLDHQSRQFQQQPGVACGAGGSGTGGSRLLRPANGGHKIDGKDSSSTSTTIGNNILNDSSGKLNLPTPAPRISILKTEERAVASNSAGHSRTTNTTYQETDLDDQITDFSLRYGENPNDESDSEEVKPPRAINTDAFGNEILLILEDSVKCYETEGTPYVISNAASVSDLRAAGATKANDSAELKNKSIKTGRLTIESSGINTPEKTTNYCEEGTPGYSVYDSYSSLDDNLEELASGNVGINGGRGSVVENSNNTVKSQTVQVNEVKIDQHKVSERQLVLENVVNNIEVANVIGASSSACSKSVTFETPMMFSRQSSLDSLSSVEPALCDDRSSVVSDFSRLASGIISPSEIPDSPSQMMPPPLSPRNHQQPNSAKAAIFPHTPPVYHPSQDGHVLATGCSSSRLRSVFEDGINTFDVENTPAQFSCATSLSNLSLDDEPKIATDSLTKEMRLMTHPSEEQEDQMIMAQQQQAEQLGGSNMFVVGPSNVVTTASEQLTSDSDETDDDNQLLANCINIGMNSGASIRNSSSSMNINNRIVTGVDNNEPQSQTISSNILDDSTSGSDDAAGNDTLLEQCIRDGIQRNTGPKPKNQSPIQILNQTPKVDNTSSDVAKLPKNNNYQVNTLRSQNRHDDSLSSISMDSEDDGLLLSQAIAAGSQGLIKTNPNPKPSNTQQQTLSTASSVGASAIHHTYPAQFRPTTTISDQACGHDSLNSIDSTDSNDTQHGSLLEQCIQSGMHKNMPHKPTTKSRSIVTTHTSQPQSIGSASAISMEKMAKPLSHSSPKRSQLPTFRSPSQQERDRQKERERKDEALLMECIQTGMSKGGINNNTAPVRTESQIKPPARHMRQVLAPTDYTQRMANINIYNQQDSQQNISKNEQTTSVAVLDTTTTITQPMSSAPCTAPDVEMTLPVEGTRESKDEQYRIRQQPQTHHQTNKIGFSMGVATTHQSASQISFGSLNLSSNSGLECSNEYPAMKLSCMESSTDTTSALHDHSFSNMEVSNEYLMDEIDDDFSVNTQKIDKHKDPDLMLKSVDRLTHELVSTAEYLRTNTSATSSEIETTVYEKKSSSNSNNTWNDETCPNDVSFPSISMTAPMITSMNDEDDDATLSDIYQTKRFHNYDEETPTNENREFLVNVTPSQPQSLDLTDSKTIVNDCSTEAAAEISSTNQINFQVGGVVQQQTFRDHNSANFISSGPFSFDTTSSAMTNSTIIALEANKLVTELLNMQTMAESSTSLDLDQIRPPSGMDTVSGYYEQGSAGGWSGSTAPLYSPQLNRARKKSLPLGLMARRALSHAAPASGSLESVNSSYNLDNIKPPSIMDELLDSMISVASITSEVVDHQGSTQHDHSTTYDTALSEIDDDTTTLKSCYDLPSDSCTPIQSDFSSAESTPKKPRSIKRALTPKQKRQIVKDRYRTYTIAADMMLHDSIDEFRNGGEDNNKDWNGDNGNCYDNVASGCVGVGAVARDGDGFAVGNGGHGGTIRISTSERTEGDGADCVVSEEMIQIEIIEDNNRRVTPRQRRHEDRSRFQTQILDVAAMNFLNDGQQQRTKMQTPVASSSNDRYRTRTLSSQDEETDGDHHLLSFTMPPATTAYLHQPSQVTFNNKLLTDTSSGSNSLDDDADMSSIRALTDRFKYIREAIIPNQMDDNAATAAANKTKTTAAAALAKLLSNNRTSTNELNSLDFEQNSETESCNQNQCTEEDDEDNDGDDDDDDDGLGGETYTVSPTKMKKPTIVKPLVKQQDRRMITGCEIDTCFTECNGNNSVSPPESKVIRGRKKATYVSPYRRAAAAPVTTNPRSTVTIANKKVLPNAAGTGSSTITTTTSSSTSNTVASPNILKPNETKKSTIAKLMPRNQTIVAKTHVLINKSNLTNKINNLKSKTNTNALPVPQPPAPSSSTTAATVNVVPPGKTPVNKITKNGKSIVAAKKTAPTVTQCPSTSSPKSQQTITPPTIPERQGTFVKDEPSNIDVPVVTSAPASPARTKLPTKLPASTACTPTSPAKNSSFISKLKNPLQRSASIGGSAAAAKNISTTPTTPSVVNSKTTNNGSVGAGGGISRRTPANGGTFYRSPSTPTVPQRSNSNASIKSGGNISQPPSRSNSNLSTTSSSLATTTKNVTSRIAGIWKKADHTNAAATKVGVCSAAGNVGKSGNNIGKPPSGQQQQQRLIRSSTFDSTPDKLVKNGGIKSTATNETVLTATATSTTKNNNVRTINSANGNVGGNNGVVRRIKNGIKPITATTTTTITTSSPTQNGVDASKRISRLGSFINVDETVLV